MFGGEPSSSGLDGRTSMDDHIYEPIAGESPDRDIIPQPPRKRRKGIKLPLCLNRLGKRSIDDCIMPDDKSSDLYSILDEAESWIEMAGSGGAVAGDVNPPAGQFPNPESTLEGELKGADELPFAQDLRELATRAEKKAEDDFTDLVDKYKVKLPILRKNNWSLGQLRANFKKLLPSQGIEAMINSWGAGALMAAAVPFYIADVIDVFRKNTTDLERAATVTMIVPILGCSLQAASDEEESSLGVASTSLCFIGDALLFSPLAILGVFAHLIAPIVRAIELSDSEHVRQLRDGEWKKHHDRLVQHFKSTEWKTKFATMYSTQQAVSLFVASEQRGLWKSVRELSSRLNDSEKLQMDLVMERQLAATQKHMCVGLQALNRRMRSALPTEDWVKGQARNFTREFINKSEAVGWETYDEFSSTRWFWSRADEDNHREAYRKKLEGTRKLLQSTALFTVDPGLIPKTVKAVADEVLRLPADCGCLADADEVDELQSTGREEVLFCAASMGYSDVIKRLLTVSNLDVNMQDKNGNTALMLAAAKGHYDLVALLLQRFNAKTTTTNHNNETAQSIAEAASHKPIGLLLRSWAPLGVPCSFRKLGEEMHGHLEWRGGCYCSVTLDEWPALREVMPGASATGMWVERDRGSCMESGWEADPL
ncbi:Bordetella pertussis toxin A [Ophiocordyceps camponoti-floridani]|uniref:Bordetella pertussis toxin A n=1 Tax=Ophiocordyceps camponoti-floridani TaxID=2030778 RepID=A0A8H4Q863_9HYPO|nr:Bordetella pertussis toxin A [Ophiocordyceps camponoti-floridani]